MINIFKILLLKWNRSNSNQNMYLTTPITATNDIRTMTGKITKSKTLSYSTSGLSLALPLDDTVVKFPLSPKAGKLVMFS